MPGGFFNLIPNPVVGELLLAQFGNEWHGHGRVGSNQFALSISPMSPSRLQIFNSSDKECITVVFDRYQAIKSVFIMGKKCDHDKDKFGLLRLPSIESLEARDVKILCDPPCNQWPWNAKRTWNSRNVKSIHNSILSDIVFLELAMQLRIGLRNSQGS